MTYQQRDFLRKQIDAQMRERVERARSAKAQATARHEAGSVLSPTDPHKTDSLGAQSRVQDQTQHYGFNLLDLTFGA